MEMLATLSGRVASSPQKDVHLSHKTEWIGFRFESIGSVPLGGLRGHCAARTPTPPPLSTMSAQVPRSFAGPDPDSRSISAARIQAWSLVAETVGSSHERARSNHGRELRLAIWARRYRADPRVSWHAIGIGIRHARALTGPRSQASCCCPGFGTSAPNAGSGSLHQPLLPTTHTSNSSPNR